MTRILDWPEPWRCSTANSPAAPAGQDFSIPSAGSHPPATARGVPPARVPPILMRNPFRSERPSRQKPHSRSRLKRSARLNRNPDGGAQSPEGTVAQQNVATVRTGDIAGNGQSETGAALILIAGVVEP